MKNVDVVFALLFRRILSCVINLWCCINNIVESLNSRLFIMLTSIKYNETFLKSKFKLNVLGIGILFHRFNLFCYEVAFSELYNENRKRLGIFLMLFSVCNKLFIFVFSVLHNAWIIDCTNDSYNCIRFN